MDIFNLDITSISLIGLLKILLKLFDLLAAKGNSESQKRTIVNNNYSVKCGENTALFIKDFHEKTINFLKNNFKEEDLVQIWEKQETIKEEPPKQTQSRRHALR